MDCGGPPLKQQQDFGIQDLWAPTTPAKIIPTRRSFVSNPGYIQRNQPSGPSWLDQVLAASSGVHTATSPWGLAFQNGICSSTGHGNHLRDLSGSLSVAHPSANQATIGSSFMPNAANTSYCNAGSMNCWSPKLSGNVIAAGNATRIFPTQFLLNGKILLPGDFCNSKSNCPGQKVQYGSTMTCLPKQNSFPETMMSFAGAISMPNLQTPTISEKYSKRMVDKQPYLGVIDLVDEDTREENLLRKEMSLSSHLAFEKPAETSFSNLMTSFQYTSFQNPQCVNDMVFLSDKLSDQFAAIDKSPTEIENEGADLNDASKQKPKRKKHRPKVIIEGKPARTPKPATPKLKTPKPAGDAENVSGKRKYTPRKKEATPSSEANTFWEIADAESRSGAKSVRRCLNFDLEDSRTIDNYSVLTSMFKQDLENHVQEVCENGTSRLIETVDSAGVKYAMVENSLTGIIFDLNGSNSQPQNEYLKILQTPVPSITVSQNVGASDNFVNSNTISNAPPKGIKRDHCLIDEAWMLNNLMHSYNSGDCASKSLDAGRQGLCPDIYKRMKMEKVHNHAISDPSPKLIYTPSTGWKTIHTSNNSQKFIYADGPKLKAQEKLQTLEGMLSSEETYVNAYNQHILGNNPTLSGFMGCNRNSTPIKPSIQKNNGMSQPSTPGKPSGYINSQECKIHAAMVQLETCEGVNNPVKAKGRRGRKKKEQHPPVNPLPSSISIGPSLGQSNPGVIKATSIHFHGENSHPKVNSVGCQDTSHHKAATHSTFSSEPLASYMDSLDDIVLKLRWLNISRDHKVSSSQAQNAIVPYVGDGGAMVPYEGTFDPIKKRRPRAKVDLDPETNRVWKLLMGKDAEGDEGANVDKEKWWEEERRVFRGRVDSFIARMHLVQGDRRFSQWKGSVVDSVIGVFLTQNVSDHLSSSAFMAIAAKFPLRSNGKYRSSNAEKVSMQSLTDLPKLQRNILDHGFCSQNYLEVNAAKNDGRKDNSCSNETLGSGTGSSNVGFYKGNPLELQETEVYFGHESPNSGSGTAATVTSISSVQLEDRRLMDEAVSSQNSLVSSQNSMAYQAQSNYHSLLNIDSEDFLIGSINNGFGSSFTELMQMAETNSFQEFYSHGTGRIWTEESSTLNCQVTHEIGNSVPSLNQLDNSKGTCQPNKVDSRLHHVQFGLSDMLPDLRFCHFLELPNSTITEDNANTLKEDSKAYLHSTTCETLSVDKLEVIYGDRSESAAENLAEVDYLNKLLSTSRNASVNDSYEPIRMQKKEQITFSNIDLVTSQHSFGHIKERKDATLHDDTSNLCSSVEAKDMTKFQQKDGHSRFKPECSEDSVRVQNQIENSTKSNSNNKMHNMQNKLDVGETVRSNKKDEACNLPKVSSEALVREEKARRRRDESEKFYDWDSLRKEVFLKKLPEKRSSDTMDSLDWEAVRLADVSEISETIRERGMNNMLAERIKDFLNRLVREHGSIDLEWLRDVPPDKSKDYLLSVRGLGLKSAECVRLLTLHHLAFPVDTNVGRICVRLGWVPLQPLPESLQLHLLEMYPVQETIQKYLWPRLCKLDQRTLYELHYQMITFGKVFCTKSKPNCNACPMRAECRHFASAFASARLALPAPEDKSIVSSTYPIASENGNPPVFNQRSIPQLECSSFSQEMTVQKNCEPIIEEPATPEPECPETSESAIEDAFLEDPDEIPMIKLNFEKFTQNLQNYMKDNMELQGGDLSKALVALNPEAASIPMHKLKNVSRLRTEHQVYEIPDSHRLLEGLDRREPDDPCPYLLAIWTPGETAQSTEPPEACCNSQDTGQLCNRSACLACNCIRESKAHKVRGTLLIPCRTAMRGSFPLNGTYFQVNEVFADHDSSRNPIDVPRDWIWNLPRRMVCFGTSIPTIFRGLTTEGIQQCFWKGFVCVRGFDRVTRAPKPLYARLHFPASKVAKNRKGSAAAEAKAEE